LLTRVRLFSVSLKTSVTRTSTAPFVERAAAGSPAAGLRCGGGWAGDGWCRGLRCGDTASRTAASAQRCRLQAQLLLTAPSTPTRCELHTQTSHREELLELSVQQRRQHLAAVGGCVLAVGPVAIKHAEEVGAGLPAVVADLWISRGWVSRMGWVGVCGNL
jgi:hypothetical protein